MKNRNKLRHIVVNKKGYLWNYYYDDMDFANYPYSYYLFVPQENRRLKVRVYFTKYAPNMKIDAYLTEGTKCLYKGEHCVLNLCRPYAARQVIAYVFASCCDVTDKGELEIRDGDAVLAALGYTDF